jgi:hypothetical protein
LENCRELGNLNDFDKLRKSANEHKMQNKRRAPDNNFGKYDNNPTLINLLAGHCDDLMKCDNN